MEKTKIITLILRRCPYATVAWRKSRRNGNHSCTHRSALCSAFKKPFKIAQKQLLLRMRLLPDEERLQKINPTQKYGENGNHPLKIEIKQEKTLKNVFFCLKIYDKNRFPSRSVCYN